MSKNRKKKEINTWGIIQGDPKNVPPTKKLITSTGFQQISSYLVPIYFSLCMIIPQTFQFAGQTSLQNTFQMTPLALQAHLQVAHKTVNDMNTFL